MDAKKTFSMDVLIDLSMIKLFQLADYVYEKTTLACSRKTRPQNVEPLPSKGIMPTIHFSNEDRMVE